MIIIRIFCAFIIFVLCYWIIEWMREKRRNFHKSNKVHFTIFTLCGGLLGLASSMLVENLASKINSIVFICVGMICGGSAVKLNDFVHTMKRKMRLKKIVPLALRDHSPAKYFITGDKHRNFDSLIDFCEVNHLRKKDVIIILGDSGFNYYEDERDDDLKRKLQKVGVTLLCLHGNKENRPENIPTYGIQTFCGGIVYYEPKYPNILFAKDGEVYTFNGKDYMVCGGAHSVDKIRCISEELPYWDDEMPDEETKFRIEMVLRERENKIHGFLTHTCPISCLPKEMFISTRRKVEDIQKAKTKKKNRKAEKRYPLDIDRSTEEWLEVIKNRTEFNEWFCGHYHVGKTLGKIRMLHGEILPFCAEDEEVKGGELDEFRNLNSCTYVGCDYKRNCNSCSARGCNSQKK